MRKAPGPGSFILLVLLGTGWGLHVTFTKLLGAADATEALAFLVVYMIGTASGLLALALTFARPYRPSVRVVRFFAISSTFGYLGPILAELMIAPRIDAAAFALIGAGVPVLTVAFGIALGRERLTPALGAALGAGALAAILLLGPAAGEAGPALWLAAAFVVPLFYAADNTYIEHAWPEGLDSLQVSGGEGVVATLICLAIAAAWGVTPGDVGTAATRGGIVLAALVTVSVSTVWLYFHLVREHGGVFVSFAAYVALGAGVVAGIVVFGERPTLAFAAAAALTVAALWLLNRDRTRAADAG